MRDLATDLTDKLYSPLRQPAYKVYAWDPDTADIADVVTKSVGVDSALDLTPYITDISWTPTTLKLTIKAGTTLFHPDVGSSRKYLSDRAVIRLFEGDANISFDKWIITFTGQIHGQIGWQINRKDKTVASTVTVYDRGQTYAFKRRKIVSKKYSAGTDLGVALEDVCDTFMNVSTAEIRLSLTLGRQFAHLTNQMVQMTPWEAVQALLQVICYDPYFDGEGKLTAVNHTLTREPDLFLQESAAIVENAVPERANDYYNKIKVTFLDATLSCVWSEYQQLGTANVTTGFFSMGEKLTCQWSDDKTLRAAATNMLVVKSVNSGLLPVGTEDYSQDDDYSGTITVTIEVWVPILATLMLAEYIVAAFVPDSTTSTSTNVMPTILTGTAGIGWCEVNVYPGQIMVSEVPATGYTIPWGRLAQAQALIVILALMMSIGSAQYEIWGYPFDYAYLEKQTIAVEDGLKYWDENEKEIKNDFIGSFTQADTIAVTELTWEKSQSNPRRITMVDDPRLELGDIIVLPDGRKLVITNLSKKIARGQVPQLTVEGCKVSKYES